ncbi:sigma-70 family RNA polymerase sigma factor [Streptomyces sp. NPDC054841]
MTTVTAPVLPMPQTGAISFRPLHALQELPGKERREQMPEVTPSAQSVPPRMSDDMFQRQWELHHRPLFRYVLRRTFGDRALAEDITQEAFIRAWQHPEVLERDWETLLPWLIKVARNLCIDTLRRRSTRPQEADLADTSSVIDKADNVDAIERLIEGQVVREALGRLPEKHRAVVVELYLADRSIAEVSEILGIPEGTVKSRTHNALRMLRRIVEAADTDKGRRSTRPTRLAVRRSPDRTSSTTLCWGP